MRTTTRRAARTALMSVLLLLLAACGGGGEEAAEPTEGAPEATAPGGAEPTEGATAEPTGAETQTEGGATSSALEGETIEFVVPYEPGGGYDQYARMAAPYLAECLGADVIVVNEPGAGGLLATNQTAVAEPDGTRVQILNTIGAAGAQIAGAEGVQFDLTELSWLARVAGEPNVLSVGANSGYDDLQDLIDSEETVRFVATGPGSSEYIGATVLSEVYGIDSEIITGFAGSGEAIAAIASGDADGLVLSLDSSLPAIQAGDLVPLALVAPEGTEEEAVPGVPTVYEYEAVDETQQGVLDAYVALVETARSVIAPADLPEDILTALREGFTCALTNEEFQATAEEAGRPVAPLTGEEIAEVVNSAMDSPEAFQELVRQSFAQ